MLERQGQWGQESPQDPLLSSELLVEAGCILRHLSYLCRCRHQSQALPLILLLPHKIYPRCGFAYLSVSAYMLLGCSLELEDLYTIQSALA